PLGAVERERLRHELAEDDREVSHDGEREDEAHRLRDRVADELADERLRHGAGDDGDGGDPDLDGRDDADGVVHQPQGGGGPATPALRELRAARRDDRVLGDDEEGVPRDEREDGQDAERVSHSPVTLAIAGPRAVREDPGMAILTDDMKRVIREQRLGFYATVCEDGSPNLSPKGTTYVLDDDHLFFADVRSPQTVENIRRGSLVEINVVDPLVRKGYRFKGPAAIH